MCVSRRGSNASMSSQTSTLSLQTAWTSFDLYMYSGVSSSAGWWKVSNCKVFCIQQGIVIDMMPTTPPDPGWCAVHPTPSIKAVVNIMRVETGPGCL